MYCFSSVFGKIKTLEENQPLFYVRILHRHVFDKCDYAKAIDDRKFFDVYRYLHRIQK